MTTENKEIVDGELIKQEEQPQVSIEQVAQRLQVLQFEINQRQDEYTKLHAAWVKVMTEKKE